MALCFSTAENACPVWRNSVHTKKVDVAINGIRQIMTECLKPTKKENFYMLSGIAPPQIRRDVATDIERIMVQADHRQPMYNITPAKCRIKSRKSFLKTSRAIEGDVDQERIK